MEMSMTPNSHRCRVATHDEPVTGLEATIVLLACVAVALMAGCSDG